MGPQLQLGPQFPPPPPPYQAKDEGIPNLPQFLEEKREQAQVSALEKILIGSIGVGLVELGLIEGTKGKLVGKGAKFAIKSGLELGILGQAIKPGNEGAGGYLNLPPGIVGGIESKEDRAKDDATRRALAAQENATQGFLKQQTGTIIDLGPYGTLKKGKASDIPADLLAYNIKLLQSLVNQNPDVRKNLILLLREQRRRDLLLQQLLRASDSILTGAGRVFPMWFADP